MSEDKLSKLLKLLNEYNRLNSAMAPYVEAKASLTSIKLDLSYSPLSSHSNIKQTYHLAGVTYANASSNEQQILSYCSRDFKSAKSRVVAKLDEKIQDFSDKMASVKAKMDSLM